MTEGRAIFVADRLMRDCETYVAGGQLFTLAARGRALDELV